MVGTDAPAANVGFGTTVKEALRKRVDFLIEHGFAQRDGDRTKLSSDLLTALRQRELDGIAKTIAKETGMAYHGADIRVLPSGIVLVSVPGATEPKTITINEPKPVASVSTAAIRQTGIDLG